MYTNTNVKEIPIGIYDMRNVDGFEPGFYFNIPFDANGELIELSHPHEIPLCGPEPTADAAKEAALDFIAEIKDSLDTSHESFTFVDPDEIIGDSVALYIVRNKGVTL
jgi:hypothetical protein